MIIFLKNLHIYVDLTATQLKRAIISIIALNTRKKPSPPATAQRTYKLLVQ